jgi:hypothetical protein
VDVGAASGEGKSRGGSRAHLWLGLGREVEGCVCSECGYVVLVEGLGKKKKKAEFGDWNGE